MGKRVVVEGKKLQAMRIKCVKNLGQETSTHRRKAATGAGVYLKKGERCKLKMEREAAAIDLF